MKFNVKVQVNAKEIKIIEVEAGDEKGAWEQASKPVIFPTCSIWRCHRIQILKTLRAERPAPR